MRGSPVPLPLYRRALFIFSLSSEASPQTDEVYMGLAVESPAQRVLHRTSEGETFKKFLPRTASSNARLRRQRSRAAGEKACRRPARRTADPGE